MVIRTSGDRLAQVALADFGGKALFVKEIEEALLGRPGGRGRAQPQGHARRAAGRPHAWPRSRSARTRATSCSAAHGGGWTRCRAGAVVGTSSLRRRALVLARRPDLRIEPIRGNVDTRLEKLRGGAYDALVMAAAGLKRLGLSPPHARRSSVDEFVPAVGQGMLAIEARARRPGTA